MSVYQLSILSGNEIKNQCKSNNQFDQDQLNNKTIMYHTYKVIRKIQVRGMSSPPTWITSRQSKQVFQIHSTSTSTSISRDQLTSRINHEECQILVTNLHNFRAYHSFPRATVASFKPQEDLKPRGMLKTIS